MVLVKRGFVINLRWVVFCSAISPLYSVMFCSFVIDEIIIRKYAKKFMDT